MVYGIFTESPSTLVINLPAPASCLTQARQQTTKQTNQRARRKNKRPNKTPTQTQLLGKEHDTPKKKIKQKKTKHSPTR